MQVSKYGFSLKNCLWTRNKYSSELFRTYYDLIYDLVIIIRCDCVFNLGHILSISNFYNILYVIRKYPSSW